ncbi:uncharacterized protein At4g04775-like [Lotus japonicus]|uniref:uncharacterized protein At4g04775-like n=1 Tax=Lotus japonicus TaxID=34305 RepID=UPI002586577E|nr:uncharacterized protein At4g04775-like [Lotus japonicus]
MSGSSKSRIQPNNCRNYCASSSSRVHAVVPHCKCGQEAVVRVSRTDLNPGKAFYSCYLPKGHVSNCNFFRWVEEEGEVVSNGQNPNNNDEEVRLLKEILLQNQTLLQEVVMMKEIMQKKNEFLVEEIRIMKGIMLKNNDTHMQQIHFMKSCVIFMGFAVLFMVFLKLFV